MYQSKTASRKRGWYKTRTSAWQIGVAAAAALATGLFFGTAAGTASVHTAKVGGTLTIADPGAPTTLDPASGNNNYAAYVDLAYEPLIVDQPNGSFTPGLAVKWHYSDENRRFTLTLRPHVKFSDGTPLTAAAVKTWIAHDIAFSGGIGTSVFANLTSMTVTGPLKLLLVFSAPTPDLELDFSNVLQMGMIGSPKALAAKTLTTATDGAGEYVLDQSQTVTGVKYTFSPNPYYWNKSAIHWKHVVINVISDPTTILQAIQTGEAQVADGQPATSIGAAKSAGVKYVAPPTLILGVILSDRGGTLSAPLGKVQVRQALNYAINRGPIASVVGSGYGTPIEQWAVPGDDSYDPKLANAYPYDPAKAKQLLAAAGYPNGFSLTVDTTSIVGEDTMAQAIAGQLAAVGVTLNLDEPSLEADYSAHVSTDPAATVGWGRLPAYLDYQFLYGPKASFWNPFKSSSPQLTSLYHQLASAPPAKVAVYARKIQDFLSTNAWFIPIAATPLVYLHASDVTGVNATAERGVDYDVEIAPAG
jgi:peptide/nickel transport system substrate-binding protein